MNRYIRNCLKHASTIFNFGEPIVEFGSLQLSSEYDLRPFFPDRKFIGCDIFKGPGVDRIEDIHQTSFENNSVGTVICLETLEHVHQPFMATKEIFRILRSDGFCIISAPMRLGIHAHPSDYWRYTPKGFEMLLKDFGRVITWYDGYAAFPDTVFALAWKRTCPPELEVQLEEFSRHILPNFWRRARKWIRAYLIPEGIRGSWWRKEKWESFHIGTLNSKRLWFELHE